MNIFSKAALFFMMATNLAHVSVLANDQEITPDEVKLDAFAALMEAKIGRNYCSRQIGCNTPGYDYCLQRKHLGCGSCNRRAAGGLGRCTRASVDLDMELDVVNNLSHDELLDMAAHVMEDYHLSEQEFYSKNSVKRTAKNKSWNSAGIANQATKKSLGGARNIKGKYGRWP